MKKKTHNELLFEVLSEKDNVKKIYIKLTSYVLKRRKMVSVGYYSTTFKYEEGISIKDKSSIIEMVSEVEIDSIKYYVDIESNQYKELGELINSIKLLSKKQIEG